MNYTKKRCEKHTQKYFSASCFCKELSMGKTAKPIKSENLPTFDKSELRFPNL